jgi:hypothetical protein
MAQTLGAIIQDAMDAVDQHVNAATGTFSLAWWTRMANKVCRQLSQDTGYYKGQIDVSVTANTQRITLPTTLCHGIDSMYWGTDLIVPKSPMQMDVDFPGWRYKSAFPNQNPATKLEVVSTSALDTTQTVSIYGTNSTTKAYQTEDITQNGGLTEHEGSTTTWGEVHYAELDAVAVGDVKVRTAAGAVICTIAAGDLSVGVSIDTADTPLHYIVENPYIWLWPIPNAGGVVTISGSIQHADLSTAATLADSQTIPYLPLQFYDTVVYGMATLAEVADLYDKNRQGRFQIYAQEYERGKARLQAYVQEMSLSRHDEVNVDDWFYQGLQ